MTEKQSDVEVIGQSAGELFLARFTYFKAHLMVFGFVIACLGPILGWGFGEWMYTCVGDVKYNDPCHAKFSGPAFFISWSAFWAVFGLIGLFSDEAD